MNQVENIYNGLGQITAQYQSVSGAVDTSTTPYVGYTYSSPSNGSLLTSMVYPNGRTINYNYSGSNLNGALDTAIGRLDSISDGANSGDAGQVLEQYSYLGLSTIVARNHPQTGINLTLVGAPGSIGAGGDQYVGLDQFGRIANQNWVNSSTGTSVDNYTYSYDQNGNVTAKNNVLNSAYSQTFTYDHLNRLSSSKLGGVANQSWSLDSQGNWSSFTSGGTTQTQTANAQNQITSISGTSGTPTYDANGNMTTDQNGNTLVYNAWNQLVSVSNSAGAVIAQYTYDARGYRISETYPVGGNGIAAGTTKYLYYSGQEQVIEERWGGTASSDVQYQYVWSNAYVNAMVLRDAYSGGSLQANSRVYTEYDTNYNVTALVGYNATTQTWGVAERFVYSPYGTVTVLSPTWAAQSDASNWQYMYQGGREDPITGLYHFDHRDYSTSLGRFISQDPLQYINGANAYQFVTGNPIGWVDPSGLDVYYNGMDLGSTTPNPPPPTQTWNDAGPFSMASEWLTGGGASIIINGTSFINNAKSSPQLQAEITQFKRQLQNKIKAAAKGLQCGKSTTVTNSDPHFTYTMPGYRFAGFGEIHVNINASITVNKDRTGHVTYSGNIDFNGYDRYQWGTAMNSPNRLESFAGHIINQTGTPFNSSWSWTEPFNGSE